MPCNCPDDRPRTIPPAACAYLAPSGGPPHSLYRLVEQAIPADAELVHGRPRVHSDGSLEFTGIPPALSGYRQEGSLLHPAWPPCTLRILKVQITDGLLNIEGICGNAEAEPFSSEVAVEQCQKCLARQPSRV
jgi:hypothetical protein